MRRLPPISTLTDTPCPDTTLFRSSACGGGGEIRLVYPPQATIQQLTLHADGRWSLNLRVENFSNVSARIDNIDLTMQVNGIAAGTITLAPERHIAPNSAEIFSLDRQSVE